MAIGSRVPCGVLPAAGKGVTQQAPRFPSRLAVKAEGVTRIIPLSEVDWFETEGNYVRLHSASASYLIRKTVVRLEDELDPNHFARVHRRYLVNVDRVVALENAAGGDAKIVMRDGVQLRLSRTFRARFLARMLTDHSNVDELDD